MTFGATFSNPDVQDDAGEAPHHGGHGALHDPLPDGQEVQNLACSNVFIK